MSIANPLTSAIREAIPFFSSAAMSIDRDRSNALLVECMRSLDSINCRDAIRKRASKRAKSAKNCVFAKFYSFTGALNILHRQNGIPLVIYTTGLPLAMQFRIAMNVNAAIKLAVIRNDCCVNQKSQR